MVNLPAKSPNKRRQSVVGGETPATTPKKTKAAEAKTPKQTPGKAGANKQTPAGKQTPAKNQTPAKKQTPAKNQTPKQENGGPAPKTPAKQNGKAPVNKQTPAKAQSPAKTPAKPQSPAKTPGKPPGPVKTPAKTQTPAKPQNAVKTPAKQNKTPAKQNKTPAKQSPKRKASESSDDASSPKKMKMFEGTKQLDEKKNKNKGKKQQSPTDGKKKKKGLVFKIIAKVAEGQGETILESIDRKIAEMKSRDKLTKSGKRRLKLLNKYRQQALGADPAKKIELNLKKGPKVQPQKQVKVKQQVVKKQPAPKVVKKEPELAKEEDDDDESDYEVESEVKPDKITKTKNTTSSDEEEEDTDDEDVEGEEDDESDEEGDEEEEEESSPAPKKGKKHPKPQAVKHPNLQELKENDILKPNEKRYVLYVNNLAYDASREEIAEHFSKIGTIRHVRIPLSRETNRPRGFAYVEVENEEAFQRGLSMHHTDFKGRRINVLYSESGKKKGEEQKKFVKAKNFKLHAMRKEGMLAGSTKDSQKRSFRRAKQANFSNGE